MARQQHQTMLLFGPPGAGKGTQGKILANIPGLCHVATGDMFRSLDPASTLGRRVTEYSSRGELVPDELTIELWQSYMQRKIDDLSYRSASDLLILDGIPRSDAQATSMEQHIDVLAIIHLKPPSIEDMVQRLKRRALREGRRDDADEGVIRRRFEVYRQETEPVLNHYPQTLVSEVSAVGLPIEVLDRILHVIAPVCREFANPLGE